jgi:3-mercaptopyruvate sulfurtransferase SseA
LRVEKRSTTLLALVAMALTLAVLWQAYRPAVAPQATMAQVRGEAQRGGYRLITTDGLAKMYREPPPNFLLVDTRQDWEYRSGHIKGAVNFPLEPTWWSRWRSQGQLTALLGPKKDRPVVFY